MNILILAFAIDNVLVGEQNKTIQVTLVDKDTHVFYKLTNTDKQNYITINISQLNNAKLCIQQYQSSKCLHIITQVGQMAYSIPNTGPLYLEIVSKEVQLFQSQTKPTNLLADLYQVSFDYNFSNSLQDSQDMLFVYIIAGVLGGIVLICVLTVSIYCGLKQKKKRLANQSFELYQQQQKTVKQEKKPDIKQQDSEVFVIYKEKLPQISQKSKKSKAAQISLMSKPSVSQITTINNVDSIFQKSVPNKDKKQQTPAISMWM